jgi:hypothetical protein
MRHNEERDFKRKKKLKTRKKTMKKSKIIYKSKTHKTMKTQANTEQRELNQLYQSCYDSMFDYIWFPTDVIIKAICDDDDLDEVLAYDEEQLDSFFFDYEDYCGIREVNGKYEVNFPIYKLDYMVGLDAVIEHLTSTQ